MKPMDLAASARALARASENDEARGLRGIAWPVDVDRERWCTSPELVSLYGTERFEAISEASRKRLALLEAVNFFSLNIHGERRIVRDLAALAASEGEHPDVRAYLRWFCHEEVEHTAMFEAFCARYHGSVYASRQVTLARRFSADEERFLFFARIVVFEEMVDGFDRAIARDERVEPLVRRIHRVHHRDEARHLAFGRAFVADLFVRYAPAWSEVQCARVREHLRGFLRASWYEHFHPDVYRDAGFADPFEVRRIALESSASRVRRAKAFERCIAFFASVGIFEEADVHAH